MENDVSPEDKIKKYFLEHKDIDNCNNHKINDHLWVFVGTVLKKEFQKFEKLNRYPKFMASFCCY